jgi:hypothetical protein
LLLWIAGSTVMVMGALSSIASSFADGRYVPENADAFYHARRILDSVATGLPVMQFDPKIHVPEGSWITWPWGFDTALAKIVQWMGPFSHVDAANRVLMNIPPANAVIAMGLVVVIARQLRLPLLGSSLLALGIALLPEAFRLFAVGNVDHHFAEFTWTLASVSAGLWFFREGARPEFAGVALGVVLGTALAIHNGLFILQVPLCLVLGLRWFRGAPLPPAAGIRTFAVALILTTLAVCIPSEPWRRGFFEFYTLSWFHCYVSALVAVFAVLLSSIAATPRSRVVLGLLAAASVLPLAASLRAGGAFVTGNLDAIVGVPEAESPYRLFALDGADAVSRISGLLFLLLPMFLANVWWLWRRRDPALQFLAAACALGLGLFQFQYRFLPFALLPMVLTPILVARELAEWRPRFQRSVAVALVAVLALAFLPTRAVWSAQWALGNSVMYTNIRTLFPPLADLCNERPGIVLADLDAGHWVRYHTECSVIANVFLLTPQHAAKVEESRHLLSLTPTQLLAERHDVRYVIASHNVQIGSDAQRREVPALEGLRPTLDPLERELLGPESALPHEFRKRWEIRTPAGQVYARLYEIVLN